MPKAKTPDELSYEQAFHELEGLVASLESGDLRLEQALQTPAKIFYKYEGVSPAGSHKPNTAIAQAYYNKVEGVKRITTETGAGQWGSALALGCNFFGIELKVYMVKVSFQQKPYRRILMETWGAEVVPSPIADPDHPGSLGAAISDAVADAVSNADTFACGRTDSVASTDSNAGTVPHRAFLSRGARRVDR